MVKAHSPIEVVGTNRTQNIVCFIVPNAQSLDVTGPLEVFSRAERLLLEQEENSKPAYKVSIASLEQGPVTLSSGLRLIADHGIYQDMAVDTLVIAGGIGISDYLDDDSLHLRLRQVAARAERVVSICNGGFLLAETGLLDGRKATTHWSYTQKFKRRYPKVDLQIDQIYCHDAPYFSSGGVTAGIDLALSLVQMDFGQKLALDVAKQLVLYLKRPGGQNQFSSILTSQVEETSTLYEVVSWIGSHYMKPIAVQDLADMAAMSLRNFSRRFSDETGFSPAKFIERVRVEQAMRLLEETNLPMTSIANQCGISSAEQLGQIFSRVLKVSPKFYRMRFR